MINLGIFVEVRYAQRRVLSRTRDSAHVRFRHLDFANSKAFPTLPATQLRCVTAKWKFIWGDCPDYFLLSPIKHLALFVALAILLIGCSRRQLEISDQDRLTRIANDCAALKQRGFEDVRIGDSCVVEWRRGHMGGASWPTAFKLEPGESVKFKNTIPEGTFNGGNKQ